MNVPVPTRSAGVYPWSDFFADVWDECGGPLICMAILVVAGFVALHVENRAIAQQASAQPSTEQRLDRTEQRLDRIEAQLTAAQDNPVSAMTRQQMATIAAEETRKANQGWWFAVFLLALVWAGSFAVPGLIGGFKWVIGKFRRRTPSHDRLDDRPSTTLKMTE